MGRITRLLILAVIIILAVLSASAKTKSMFAANKNSVGLENHYADAAEILRFRDDAEVERGVQAGTLVPIPITVAPKLPEFRRFVRPAAADFMLELDTRFYLTTGHFLIVDSGVRSAQTQAKLARHNRNAAPANGERASSHERGTTFDIAKKTWLRGYSRMRRGEYHWLLIQLAYYQAIGKIHVIEEKACFHIMVREDYELPQISRSGDIPERIDEEVVCDERRN
jgi:hypothetical protein